MNINYTKINRICESAIKVPIKFACGNKKIQSTQREFLIASFSRQQVCSHGGSLAESGPQVRAVAVGAVTETVQNMWSKCALVQQVVLMFKAGTTQREN